jgi:hypothetical protein
MRNWICLWNLASSAFVRLRVRCVEEIWALRDDTKLLLLSLFWHHKCLSPNVNQDAFNCRPQWVIIIIVVIVMGSHFCPLCVAAFLDEIFGHKEIKFYCTAYRPYSRAICSRFHVRRAFSFHWIYGRCMTRSFHSNCGCCLRLARGKLKIMRELIKRHKFTVAGKVCELTSKVFGSSDVCWFHSRWKKKQQLEQDSLINKEGTISFRLPYHELTEAQTVALAWETL